MKKKIGITILVGVFGIVSYFGYGIYKSRTGERFYLQLRSNPQCKRAKYNELECKYKESSYNKDGLKKIVEFYSLRERPLRKNAFLEIKVNDERGVLTYSEVSENEIPKKAFEKINNE